MWKFLLKSCAAVYLVAVVGLAVFSQWRFGFVQWRLICALAAFAPAIFALRIRSRLVKASRSLFIRSELRRRRERIRALGAAVNELIRSMANLSPGDLSVYHSILGCTAEDDVASVLTSMGSPNHNVLVQMCDLKFAVPEEAKSFGDPPHRFTSMRYALTALGRRQLPGLLADALRYRAFLSEGAGRA